MFPTSSDSTFGVGDVEVEGDVEMEEEVKVKTKNGIDGEEEKCVGLRVRSECIVERKVRNCI
jgi:hypothetical protein